MSANNEVNFLKLTLHERLVGYLAGYRNGRNVLSFADEFKQDAKRPTFSLITHPSFPKSEQLMSEPWTRINGFTLRYLIYYLREYCES